MVGPEPNPKRSGIDAQEVYSAFLEELQKGKSADFEVLCASYPERIAEELRKLNRIFHLGQSLATSSSFHQSIAERFGDVEGVTIALDSPADTSDGHVGTRLRAGSDAGPPRYAFESEVDRGGMGIVFRVRDHDLNRSIAMKVLRGSDGGNETSKAELARFLEEAQVTAQLDHPGIVPVHELGINGEREVYFTMRLVKGKTLGEIFDLARAERDGWNLARAVGAVVKACQAVAFAHTRGVIHRDLKPTNIMVGRLGEVYVMDWGLAKITGKEDLHDIRVSPDASFTVVRSDRREDADSSPESPLVTMDGSVVGTPAYMPPEQAEGRVDEVDRASDVYSLGATLYNLLAGQPPYVPAGTRISPRTILAKVQDGPPRPVHELNRQAPPELVAICEKAMARDKARRYGSSLELAEDLQAFLDRRVVRAYRTGAVAELRSWITRNRTAATLGALALAVMVGLISGWIATEQSALRLAKEGEAQMRRELYAASMKLAEQALAQGELAAMGELLDSQVPAPGQDDLRGFEWYYFWGLGDQEGAVLTDHRNAVTTVAHSPDGRFLVSCGGDQSIRIRDARTGEVQRTLRGHRLAVTSATFSPRGDRLASGDDTGRVVLWEMGGHGRRVAEAGDPIRKLRFMADGERLIVLRATRAWNPTWQASMVDWSSDTPEERTVLELGQVFAATISSDGSQIAYQDQEGVLWIAFVSEGAGPVNLTKTERLDSLTFSPDGKSLVAGANSGTLRVFALSTATMLAEISGAHAGGIHRVAFDANGDLLATAGVDLNIRLWNVTDWTPGTTMSGHQSSIGGLSFSPQGDQLASCGSDGSVRLWPLETRRPRAIIERRDGPIESMDFSQDGRFLAVIGGKKGRLRLWDLETDQERAVQQAGSDYHEVRFAPYESVLAVSSDSAIAIYDVAENRWRSVIPMEAGRFGRRVALSFSPDGEIIAVGQNRDLTLLRARTGECLSNATTYLGWIVATSFPNEGQRIFVADSYRTLSLRDVTRQQQLWSATSDLQANVSSARASPGRARMAIGSRTGKVIVWDLARRTAILRIRAHLQEVSDLAFTPDEMRIATASTDGTLRIWRLSDGKELLRIVDTADGPRRLAFSPDGKTLALGSAMGVVSLLRAATRDDVLARTPAQQPENLAALDVASPPAVALRASPFRHPIESVAHGASRWQVRAAETDYSTPAVDTVSARELERLVVPLGILRPGRTYFWRVCFSTTRGVWSPFSHETSFTAPDIKAEFVPFALRSVCNSDVIMNLGDPDNDPFDTFDCFLIEAGFDGERPDNPAARGLPSDRVVGVHHLVDYSGKNAIQLSPSDDSPIRIDCPAARYAFLRLLVSGGNNDSVVPLTCHYRDGTRQRHLVRCDDWYDDPVGTTAGGGTVRHSDTFRGLSTGAVAAINGMDRICRSVFYSEGDPALFEVRLELDRSKELDHVVLEVGEASYCQAATRFNLLAITGVRVGEKAASSSKGQVR